jgi:hypothetical protein
MRKRNAKLLVPVAVAGAAALAASGGLAWADGGSSGGEVHIYEADTALDGSLGTVIVTGAITDYGTDNQGYGGDGINLIQLSKGSFEINVNGVGNQLASLPVDPKTCSSDGSATAPVPIVAASGTGAYKGISGTFNTTSAAASILPRLNGKCNANATQYPGVLIANGAGTVSFGK